MITRLHPEQVKLLYHDDYRHYVKANPAGEDHPAFFSFGRILRVEEFLAREAVRGNAEDMDLDVRRYYLAASKHKVLAVVHSASFPGGRLGFESVEGAWPISSGLWRTAAEVHFDLAKLSRDDSAVFDSVVDKWKEATAPIS